MNFHLEYKKYKTDKLLRLKKIVRERYKVNVRQLDFKDKEKFKEDVNTLKQIYNEAWEPNWGFVKMTDEEFDFLANDLKQVADPSLALIVEVGGEPAGFALAMPDINQCLIHNPKGGLVGAGWNLLTKNKKITFLRIIVLGVIPRFQKTGVDAVMYYEIGERGHVRGIDDGEASWVLEDNTMMNRGLTVTMDAVHYKTYRIYEREL